MPSHLLRTNRTGLAGGTNFQIVSSSPNGTSVVCAETVANVGAERSAQMLWRPSDATGPFTLERPHATLKYKGANCTGAGTIKLTPICTGLTRYAIAN